ncbi:MAG TPA: LamG-like jellyroll fold domain-containing protein [Woeseiaceae bacterium]|nr:LamG-like jellyroll fold domain-containing protein [Woeseiaceae bacterium]
MTRNYSVLYALLLLTGFSVQALAGPCDAYYRFDGNLSDEGGNGNAGQMIGPEGATATPQFVEGRSGQALKLDGSAAMRAFVDLNRDRCPQMTVTAWIKIQPLASQTILGTGGGAWLWASGSVLGVRTAGKDLRVQDAIYANGGWMFVAAVWDHKSGTHRLHWHGRHAEAAIGTRTKQAKPAIWLGANNDSLHHRAKDLVIDEMRIIGSALDVERIMAMRDAPAGAGQSQPAMAAAAGQACSSHAGCPAGSYCGMDGTCHPDSHRPMQSTGSGTTLQDLQASSAQRNADIAGTVDYESPTDLLENAGTGQSTRLSPETEQAIAERVAENRPPEIGYASEEEAVAAAERREQERLEEERRQAEAEAQAAAAAGPPEFYPAPPESITQYSGSIGSIERRVDLIGFETFFHALAWGERRDRPCHVRVRAGDEQETSISFACSGWGLWGDPNMRSVATAPDAPVYAIQVCNNSRNAKRRLKGVRVWGAKINPDGTTSPANVNDEEELNNCNDWAPRRTCPDNQIATGVVVMANDAGGDDKADITGLRLICHSVGIR